MPERNAASLMMRMEATRDPQELVDLLAVSAEWLGKTNRSLWLDYLMWAGTVLVPHRFPNLRLDQLNSYVEGVDMLAEAMEEWREKERKRMRREERREGRREGHREGIEQGLTRGHLEGKRRGKRELLHGLATRRFSEHSAERLEVFLDEPIRDERLAKASDWILDCQSEEEFLRRLESVE